MQREDVRDFTESGDNACWDHFIATVSSSTFAVNHATIPALPIAVSSPSAGYVTAPAPSLIQRYQTPVDTRPSSSLLWELPSTAEYSSSAFSYTSLVCDSIRRVESPIPAASTVIEDPNLSLGIDYSAIWQECGDFLTYELPLIDLPLTVNSSVVSMPPEASMHIEAYTSSKPIQRSPKRKGLSDSPEIVGQKPRRKVRKVATIQLLPPAFPSRSSPTSQASLHNEQVSPAMSMLPPSTSSSPDVNSMRSVTDYMNSILTALNDADFEGLDSAINHACANDCIFRTQKLMSGSKPIIDRVIPRLEFSSFFKAAMDVYPDCSWVVEKTKVRKGKPTTVVSTFRFNGTLLPSPCAKYDTIFVPSNLDKLAELQADNSPVSVSVIGTFVLSLNKEMTVNILDMIYLAEVSSSDCGQK